MGLPKTITGSAEQNACLNPPAELNAEPVNFESGSGDHIANVACPVFIMSGEKDRTTRPDETETLFSRAQLPKQLWFVPKAGHVDLHKAAGAENESRILAFLEQM